MFGSGTEPPSGSQFDSPGATAAPRHLRLAATLLDVLLAFAATFAVRSLVHAGTLPALGGWRPGDAGFWIDAQLVFMGLGLASLRDVPFGSSLSKWLLCLRLERADGHPLGLVQRLLRAPISLLPLALLSDEIGGRMPWRVVGYAPSTRGLALRTGLTSAAAAASILWAVETVRPSIGQQDASRLAEQMVAGDPVLRRELGDPVEMRILAITPRAHQAARGKCGTFDLQLRGLVRQQEMVVHARKVDGAWVVEEADDIDIRAVPFAREAVASR